MKGVLKKIKLEFKMYLPIPTFFLPRAKYPCLSFKWVLQIIKILSTLKQLIFNSTF